MPGFCHCFCKRVGQLIMKSNLGKMEISNINLFKNKMVVDFYVLHAFMKYRVGTNTYNTRVINKQRSRSKNRYSKFMKMSSKPYDFTAG